MGIFDSVLGASEGAAGGLFSSTSAFRQTAHPLAVPPPATAHLAALKQQGYTTGGGQRGRARGRDDGSDSSGDSDSDSDGGGGGRKKGARKKGRKEKADTLLQKSAANAKRAEKASVEDAYEAAAAIMADHGTCGAWELTSSL
jgi:hypothetical protein